jgi:hypothetical protein
MAEFNIILKLVWDVVPQKHAKDMPSIVGLNQGGLAAGLENNAVGIKYMSEREIDELLSNTELWTVVNDENSHRLKLLRFLVAFRSLEHMEMLDLSEVRKILSPTIMKKLLNQKMFQNLTIHEKQVNQLLSLQGYTLRCFINAHLRQDMRFKTTIDSFMIEMDTPYTRTIIREENRKDPVLSEKYLNQLDIENFTIYLLNNFFPDIAGIWADHTHEAPYLILQLIRISFEYGFYTVATARKILKELSKITKSLLKLEEGWIDRLSDLNRLSDMIKASNIVEQFSKCRENIAFILIHTIVLLSDDVFMQTYPLIISKSQTDKKNSSQFKSEEQADEYLKKQIEDGFCFYEKDINDTVLFITMNYLSNVVHIGPLKSTSKSSRSAIEKIFLYISSTHRDPFLTSLKQIKQDDLRYIEAFDVISPDIRTFCDDMGNALRQLLILIGQGAFDRYQGYLSKSAIGAKESEHLQHYIPSENASLTNIITRILDSIDDRVRLNEDYKAGFAKESIPLALIAIADYLSEYFEPSISAANRDIFSKLSILCAGSNPCKSQLFKGDALKHLNKLVKRLNKDVFLFISNFCSEDNSSLFLGRDFFTNFLNIYHDFNKQFATSVDNDAPLEIEKSSIFFIMTKIIRKILKKPFLEERDKLQNCFLAQSAFFSELGIIYLPKMIAILRDPAMQSLSKDESILSKKLFQDESERELINVLENQPFLSPVNQKIFSLHVYFEAFKAFNTVCSDSYTSVVYKQFAPHVQFFDELLRQGAMMGKRWIEPIGLDVEIISFLRNFEVFPEQNILVETKVELEGLPKLQFKNHQPFLVQCIERTSEYTKNTGLRSEGTSFIFEGLFPLLYKFVKSIKNLTNFDRTQAIVENIEILKSIMVALNSRIRDFNTLVDKEVIQEEAFTVTRDNKDRPAGVPGERTLAKKSTLTLFRLKKKEEEAAKTKNSKNSEILNSKQYSLASMCDNIVDFFSEYYEEAEQDHQDMFKSLQDIDEEKYEEIYYAAKFEEKANSEILALKKSVLNKYIKIYQKTKEEYLTREEEPNLMSFFDRNTQNLRGVFESCLEKLMGRTKVERNLQAVRWLSSDYAIERFWVNPACYAYVSFLEKLLTMSKTARKEFYQFINEDRNLKNQLKEVEELSEQDKETYSNALAQMMKASDGRFRDNFLTVLIRIHVDLLIFLNSSSSLKLVWWVVNDTYSMISGFFKNLCECNFLEFKEYLSTYEPGCKDEGWLQLRKCTAVDIFVKELAYVNLTCKISKNKEPIMTHSDQIEKIEPILGPLIQMVNETVTGPCSANQKKLLQVSIDGIINIAVRVIDELNSDYFILSDACMTLLLSLTEGYEEEVLKTLAAKLPSSVLVDRLFRFSKKIYIKELIQAGEFEKMAYKQIESNEKADKEKQIIEVATTEGQPGGAAGKPVDPMAPNMREMVVKALAEQKIKEDEFIITEDMEGMVSITDWEDLYDLYMKRPEFSESQLFLFIFKIMILWQTLSLKSKSHKSRLDDAKYESDEYFGETGLFGLDDKKDTSKSKGKKNDNNDPSEFACIFYFISEKVKTEIEIVDPTGKPIKIYFPKAPPCYMLSEENKNAYREECRIDDSNTKMLDLMRNFKMFEIMMTSDLKTWRKIGFLFKFLSADAFQRYTFGCWVIGVILNIVIAASIVMDQYGESFTYRSDTHQLAARIIGYCLVAVSAVFLVVWLLSKYSQTYRTRLEDYKFDRPGQEVGILGRIRVMLAEAYFKQAYPMNYTLHILFTVLGLELNIFFLSLNLLLIINISRTCKFVLTSIVLHADQLILTLILAVFVIFFYAMILGNIFTDLINDDQNTPCESLITCFFYTINLGLRSGGGVSDQMKQPNILFLLTERTIFDITFFMLINVISLNIVFGIIIDTFSQLRDAQYERCKTLWLT